MTITELSDQFDVLYNNITSNQAPGLNEYEKSVFLTKAAKEVVKNYFSATSKGNTLGQGFDDSAKRQADFSVLMKTASCTQTSVGGTISNTRRKYTCTATGGSSQIVYDVFFSLDGSSFTPSLGTYTVTYSSGVHTLSTEPADIRVQGFPFATSGGTITIAEETVSISTGKIDTRSEVWSFPNDVFIVINETVTVGSKIKQVIPLGFDEYTRLMSKPFKRPLKNQVWRLINSGSVTGGKGYKTVEIIPGYQETISAYYIRYVRAPKPIIVANLDEGLSIDGQSLASTECELDPILHEDILQRAVELAKIAWTATGQDNAQLVIQAGQRSE